MWQRLRAWAKLLKAETLVLWFCCKHPDTPLAAKILATLVVAYALSPIDLIPDFIPVLGYLDDVILVPAGIWLVIRLIPHDVMEEQRALAEAAQARPVSWRAAATIVAIWIAVTAGFAWWLHHHLTSN